MVAFGSRSVEPFPRKGAWAVFTDDAGQRRVGIINLLAVPLLYSRATGKQVQPGDFSEEQPQEQADRWVRVTAELQLVDEKGETIQLGTKPNGRPNFSVFVLHEQLEQAAMTDIPIPRRPHDVRAHALGYLSDEQLAEFPRLGAHVKSSAHEDKGVGVIQALPEDGTATLAFLDANGHVVAVEGKVPLDSLTQATHDELPEPNRTSWQHAVQLGYLPPDYQPPAEPETKVEATTGSSGAAQ